LFTLPENWRPYAPGHPRSLYEVITPGRIMFCSDSLAIAVPGSYTSHSTARWLDEPGPACTRPSSLDVPVKTCVAQHPSRSPNA
ncbi:hypothetical protein FRC08_011546, partial [Ceratobasidium sp. 394]